MFNAHSDVGEQLPLGQIPEGRMPLPDEVSDRKWLLIHAHHCPSVAIHKAEADPLFLLAASNSYLLVLALARG